MKLNCRRWVLLMAVCLGGLTTVGVSAQTNIQENPITIGLDVNYAPCNR